MFCRRVCDVDLFRGLRIFVFFISKGYEKVLCSKLNQNQQHIDCRDHGRPDHVIVIDMTETGFLPSTALYINDSMVTDLESCKNEGLTQELSAYPCATPTLKPHEM